MICKKTYRKNFGFTLIETLVAVLILVMAISGPLTIAAKGLSTALIAKDQITAQYLAQDGMEYIRFVRDSNQLLGINWMVGLDASNSGSRLGGCVSANGCNVDSLSDTVESCTGACTSLKFDSTSGSYITTGSGLPSFTRTVNITVINIHEVRVTITVAWSSVGSSIHKVQVSENIQAWQ